MRPKATPEEKAKRAQEKELLRRRREVEATLAHASNPRCRRVKLEEQGQRRFEYA
jgi:hypothetical protein